MTVIEFDPIFALFTKESVLLAMFGNHEDLLTKKELFLREIIEKYMDGGYAAIEAFLSDKSEKYIQVAASEWKKGAYAETSAGRITKITDECLMKNQGFLKYKDFPREVYDTASYYRKLTPREMQFLVTWKNESMISEEDFLTGLKQALKINNRMNLDEITEYIMAHNAERELKSKAHSLAIDVMQSIGIDRDSPNKTELILVEEWIQKGWTKEDILMVCASATGNPTLRYIHAIILNIDKIREGTGLKTVQEVFDLIHEFRETTGASGKKQLHPNNTIQYYQMRKKYDRDLVCMATETARNEFQPYSFNKEPLLYIERIILRWKKEGVNNAEEAEIYLRHREEEVGLLRKVFDTIGISRKTNEMDYKTLRKWREMGFDELMILRAAEDALDAENPMIYMSKILSVYKEKGISTPNQADAAREAYLREKRAQKEKSRVKTSHYENQRDYSGEQEKAMQRMIQMLEKSRQEKQEPPGNADP